MPWLAVQRDKVVCPTTPRLPGRRRRSSVVPVRKRVRIHSPFDNLRRLRRSPRHADTSPAYQRLFDRWERFETSNRKFSLARPAGHNVRKQGVQCRPDARKSPAMPTHLGLEVAARVGSLNRAYLKDSIVARTPVLGLAGTVSDLRWQCLQPSPVSTPSRRSSPEPGGPFPLARSGAASCL